MYSGTHDYSHEFSALAASPSAPAGPSTAIEDIHSGTFAKGTYDTNLGYVGGTPYADMMTLTAYPTDKAPKLPAATASA
ncbi:hypothetical protein ELI00_34050 [Rhizobium ruizarguesonis]|nr:hypothetical protein ELI20_35375 [Rhizobium ruizarguesonis]TAX64875.1 hypothetical protein ELI00_34050 [Rhizobium ruizarguesonis]